MPRDHDRFDQPEPPLSPAEEQDINHLSAKLRDERPIPRAGFRGALRTYLLVGSGSHQRRPARLRLLIAAYASGGLALLAFAAAGVFGAGPLAA